MLGSIFRAPTAVADRRYRFFAENPNGIPALSPGLRAGELPWVIVPRIEQPRRGCSHRQTNGWHNPVGVGRIFATTPRVVPRSGPTLGWRRQPRWGWLTAWTPRFVHAPSKTRFLFIRCYAIIICLVGADTWRFWNGASR